MTFLRTVREGPTDRSYGIHVADLAGVSDPVVDRSRDVLESLREEKAIEAKGGSRGEPVQAVFNVGSGEFRGAATADGGAGATGDSALDTEAQEILDSLQDLDVNETPPVELMAKVQEWQAELGDD